MTTATSDQESPYSWIRKQYEWANRNRFALTLATFGFLMMKVVIVSRGSLETALAIVNSNGAVTVVVGELLSGLPILATIGLGAAVFDLAGRVARRRNQEKSPPPERPPSNGQPLSWATAQRAMPWLLALSAVVVGICYVPWGLFLSVGFLCAIEGWRAERADSSPAAREARWRPPAAVQWLAVGIVATLGLYSLFLGIGYAMWIPHERLSIVGKSAPEVGYVVDSSSGWITVLESGTRRPVRFAAATVSHREVCHVRGRFDSAQYSLLQWGFRLAHARFGALPACRAAGRRAAIRSG